DVEDEDAERVINLEVEPCPIGIVKHQLDIGLLRNDFIEPALFQIVAMDAVVELARLSVGDSVEIDAVEILKRGKLIAVEAGGAGVGEIVLGFCPPTPKLLSRLPGSERMVPGVIAVPPQARQVHPSSMLGFHITRQLIERPKMIMRVDRG